MNTGSARQGSLRTGLRKLVLVLTVLALLVLPSGAMAARPAHTVRGHGIFTLNNPPSAIDQISINASADENGVVTGGMAVGIAIYLAPPDQPPPDYAGWIWKIRIDSLSVTNNNVAEVKGTVVEDNRFPDYLGCAVIFIITDNGSGSANPDVLEWRSDPDHPHDPYCVYDTTRPILGGNFTVR